jgi:hypothetical protein
MSNLYIYDIAFNALNFSVHTTACHDLLTGLQTITEIIKFLLTFSLGAYHHKVHDSNNQNEHKDGAAQETGYR